MTDTELESAAEHVCYEMERFLAARKYLAEFRSNEEIRWLLLEAFLLHYRNIRNFFVAAPQRDDIVAEHFVTVGQKWEAPHWPDHVNDPRASADEDYTEKKLLDKCLSHLTYLRLDANISWPVEEMVRTVRAQFSSFANLLPVEKQRWFDKCRGTAHPVSGFSVESMGTPTIIKYGVQF